ncbi:hypothetical protein BH24GEM2_BH24GEM2_19000 [soil metagenome]
MVDNSAAYLLLAAAQIIGILLIPLGLPGLWIQVGALALYAWQTDFATMGAIPIVVVVVLGLAAEALEFGLGGRYARRYGGGRRAAWGAILGGIVGAIMGVPVPIIGSVIGAFVGSFVGAALLELTTGRGANPALRAGWGALLGRIAATALKVGIGIAIAVVALFSAL